MGNARLGVALALGSLLFACPNVDPTPHQGPRDPRPSEDASVTQAPLDQGGTETSPPSRPPVQAIEEPVPGFVVYGAGETVVIPIEQSATVPIVRMSGLWVLDDAGVRAQVLRAYDPAFDPTLPPCPCADIPAGCTPGPSLEPASEVGAGTACGCVQRLTEDHRAMPLEVDGEVFEACRDDLGDSGPASLVGGKLFYAGWDSNGACYGGLNLYGAWTAQLDVVAAPGIFPDRVSRFACTYDVEPASVPRPWPVLDGLKQAEDCWDESPEAEMWVLRRGWLWRVDEYQSGSGGWRGIHRVRARPSTCPTDADPCGDPTAFSFRGLGRNPEFWVRTDGSAALSGVGSTYRVHRPGEEAQPVPIRLPGLDSTRGVMGVRVHTDLRPLLEAVPGEHLTQEQLRSSPPPDPDACPQGDLHPLDVGITDPRKLGNRCIAHRQNQWWSSAEAACRHGLAAAESETVEAALLYNLALLAQDRGVPAYALALVTRSLELRPGNGATQAKQRELTRLLD